MSVDPCATGSSSRDQNALGGRQEERALSLYAPSPFKFGVTIAGTLETKVVDDQLEAPDQARSRLMRRVRRTGTSPELQVRRMLTELGAHYRLNVPGLPGRPDVANKRLKKAIFVNGCFWHYHQGCSRATVPAKNHEFWRSKLLANRESDRRKADCLRELGFEVAVVWECELGDPEGVRDRLRAFWFGGP